MSYTESNKMKLQKVTIQAEWLIFSFLLELHFPEEQVQHL